MGQQLTFTRPVPPPVAPSTELRDAAAAFTNKLDSARNGTEFTIAHENAPSPEVRQRLEQRRAMVDRWLAPIGQKDVAGLIMQMTVSLTVKGDGRTRAGTSATAEAAAQAAAGQRFDAYVQLLAEQPAFAVKEACEDYREGRAGDGKFMPEPAQLRLKTLDKAKHYRIEQAQLTRLLTARVLPPKPTAEQRAATVARARQAMRSIGEAGLRAEAVRSGLNPDDVVAAKPETNEEEADRLRGELRDTPVTLSPGLLRKEQIRRGIDVDAADEEARLQHEFAEQEHQARRYDPVSRQVDDVIEDVRP